MFRNLYFRKLAPVRVPYGIWRNNRKHLESIQYILPEEAALMMSIYESDITVCLCVHLKTVFFSVTGIHYKNFHNS